MATYPGNEQQLRDVGVLIKDEVPQEYAAVVESLTPEELEVIIAVKKRLDEAGRESDKPVGEFWIAP